MYSPALMLAGGAVSIIGIIVFFVICGCGAVFARSYMNMQDEEVDEFGRPVSKPDSP